MEHIKRIIERIVRWWLPDRATKAAQEQYIACVNGARNPFLYTSCGVPDDGNGRFEMVMLHVALVLRRMRAHTPKFESESLHLVEAFFRDMDHNFREMGIGDLRVGGKVKGCVGILYGRCNAYDTALSSNTGLEDALRRNVFAVTGAPNDAGIVSLAQYVREADALLTKVSDADLLAANIAWPKRN